jgi:hypothetical protein
LLNVAILAWMSIVAAILHAGGSGTAERVLHFSTQLSLYIAAWVEAGTLKGRWAALTDWSRVFSTVLFLTYLVVVHLVR